MNYTRKGDKMSGDFLQEIINYHHNKGLIEDKYVVCIVDNNLFKLNRFTLRLSKLKSSIVDVSYYNAQIFKYISKNSLLTKEIKEFKQLFKFLEKVGIKDGFIKKSETPDFIMYRNGKTYGIEVTKLYTGNDWVAEKVHNDIVAYKLTGQKFKDYVITHKYSSRFKTIEEKDDIKVSAIKSEEYREEEIIQIKNKIFEKIRRQIDEYEKYNENYIFAEIVFSGYKEITSYEELSEEINYFVSHLEVNFGENTFHLILKNGNIYADFDLKNGNVRII